VSSGNGESGRAGPLERSGAGSRIGVGGVESLGGCFLVFQFGGFFLGKSRIFCWVGVVGVGGADIGIRNGHRGWNYEIFLVLGFLSFPVLVVICL